MATSITQLRNLIRAKSYVVSLHAADELEDDNLTILDLESVVLTGKIAERQYDQQTNETKYRINGVTLEGYEAEAIVKIGFTGAVIIITAYLA
jgi:Domain of unknown function (DUF4258)